MKEQIDSLPVKGEREMNETNVNPWFNFQYKVICDPRDNSGVCEAIIKGKVIPHPVGMDMTLDQFLNAEGNLRASSRFLELEVHRLDSPKYSAESVRKVNDFAAVFGGIKTKATPDVTTDMGFGEMYLRIYVHRDQRGTVTVRNSTSNKYANEIGLYGFSERGFKEAVDELGLPR